MLRKLFWIIGILLTIGAVAELPEKPIVVIIPSYNNVDWFKLNLESVLTQQYANFRVIYIDDCSTDGTGNEVQTLVQTMGKQERFTFICNKARRGAMANLYDAILSCRDEEIVVTVDGDDWLYDDCVLKTVNQAYSSNDVWLTHGTMIRAASGCFYSPDPITSKIIRDNVFRSIMHPTHLRTFYAWLFKKIDKEDLMYQGNFFKAAWDLAMMYPMIEMAGERHAFIPAITYVYNDLSPINDFRAHRALTQEMARIILSKKPYQRLSTIFGL